MKNTITRRRFISITAAAASASLVLPSLVRASTSTLHRWHGRALGAQAEILLNIPSDVDGPALVEAITDELARLEGIFSIYQANSSVSKLNQQGWLENPPMELVDLLMQAHDVSEKTKGTFDVTVQPLWLLMNENQGREVSDQIRIKVSELVDYKAVSFNEKEIRFAKPGMAITLNGIAQGYITDRVTRLMASHGLDNSLVQLGETRALGGHPNGRDWRVGLPNDGAVDLRNQSLATSGGAQDSFVFDPRSSDSSKLGYDSISVVARTAVAADALSTAFSIMPKDQIVSIVKTMPDVKVVMIKNGVVETVRG